MDRLLTMSRLAAALGVSESSVKRWADDGAIVCSRTVGGHRRVSVADAVWFIRRTRSAVVRPELLGLGDLSSLPPRFSEESDPTEALYGALESGATPAVRAMLQSLYIQGRSLAGLFDGPVRAAMARIGELWLHAEWGIVVEHRATSILVGALSSLRSIMPTHDPSAPVAVGGAGPNDTYVVPSLMASLVMAEAGFTDVNLGPMTPASVLLNASTYYGSRVAWLSLSVPWDGGADAFVVKGTAPGVMGQSSGQSLEQSSGQSGPSSGNAAAEQRTATNVAALAQELSRRGTKLIVGGRGLAGVAPADAPEALFAGSMVELLAYARDHRLSPVLPSPPGPPGAVSGPQSRPSGDRARGASGGPE